MHIHKRQSNKCHSNTILMLKPQVMICLLNLFWKSISDRKDTQFHIFIGTIRWSKRAVISASKELIGTSLNVWGQPRLRDRNKLKLLLLTPPPLHPHCYRKLLPAWNELRIIYFCRGWSDFKGTEFYSLLLGCSTSIYPFSKFTL